MTEEVVEDMCETHGVDSLELDWKYSKAVREMQVCLETHTDYLDALEGVK